MKLIPSDLGVRFSLWLFFRVVLISQLEESDEFLVSRSVIWVPDFDCDFDFGGEGFADVVLDFLDFNADASDFGPKDINTNPQMLLPQRKYPPLDRINHSLENLCAL